VGFEGGSKPVRHSLVKSYEDTGLGEIMAEEFKQDYNHDRPHDSLKNMTPIERLQEKKT
jgi:transposase InsO family protein